MDAKGKGTVIVAAEVLTVNAHPTNRRTSVLI